MTSSWWSRVFDVSPQFLPNRRAAAGPGKGTGWFALSVKVEVISWTATMPMVYPVTCLSWTEPFPVLKKWRNREKHNFLGGCFNIRWSKKPCHVGPGPTTLPGMQVAFQTGDLSTIQLVQELILEEAGLRAGSWNWGTLWDDEKRTVLEHWKSISDHLWPMILEQWLREGGHCKSFCDLQCMQVRSVESKEFLAFNRSPAIHPTCQMRWVWVVRVVDQYLPYRNGKNGDGACPWEPLGVLLLTNPRLPDHLRYQAAKLLGINDVEACGELVELHGVTRGHSPPNSWDSWSCLPMIWWSIAIKPRAPSDWAMTWTSDINNIRMSRTNDKYVRFFLPERRPCRTNKGQGGDHLK